MSYRFFLKIVSYIAVASIVTTLSAAHPLYAKGETYTWDGSTIVGSGGQFTTSGYLTSSTNNELPSTFTRADSDTVYKNYTGDTPAEGKCGATLHLNSGRTKISSIDITCNIRTGAYSSDPESTYTSGQFAMDTTADIAGTPPAASESLSSEYLSSVKVSATYQSFDHVLDDIRTSYCNKIDDVSDKSIKATCLSTGFQNIVYTCWSSARSGAASAARYDPKTDTATLTKSLFSDCLSGKTDYSASDILQAIKDVDVTKINGAGSDAVNSAKNTADKNQCTSGGGTWNDSTGTCTAASTDETDSETESCAVDYVGWIVCPTIKFLARVTDESYGFLADSFLSTPTSLLEKTDSSSGEESAIYTTWKAFQNIANVILAIGFLIIIYSQLTGVGLTNYSVKKMLPKIIIAALLINLSFYICALAVDLSNILGYGIKSFLANISGSTGADISNSWQTGDGTSGFAGTALLVLAGGSAVSAGAGGVSLALVALVGVLLSGAVALITIFFILMIRQVLIVLLIVASPIAFATYFLPNTKQWFDKWKKTFTALLMIFPIIGVVYGASTLASNILSKTYTTSSNAVLGQIISAAVLILPLFIVPGLLKKSLDSVSGIGGKLSEYGSKLGGGMKGRLANSDYAKYHHGKASKRREQIRAGAYEGRGGRFNPSNWRSTANRRIGGSSAMGAISGGYTSTLAQRGQAALARQDKEEAEASDSYVKALNLSNDELRKAALSGETTYKVKDSKGNVVTDKDGKEIVKTIKLSEDQHRAAIRSFTPIATASQAEELAEASSSMSVAARKELSTTMATSGAIQKVPHLGGKSIEDIANGTYSKSEAANNYSKNKISADSLATMDADALNTLVSDAETRQAAGDSAAMESLMKARTSLNESPELRSKIKAGSRDVIDRIPTRTTGTPPRGGTPTP